MSTKSGVAAQGTNLAPALVIFSALSCSSACISCPGEKEKVTAGKASCSVKFPLSPRSIISIALAAALFISFFSFFKTSEVLVVKRSHNSLQYSLSKFSPAVKAETTAARAHLVETKASSHSDSDPEEAEHLFEVAADMLESESITVAEQRLPTHTNTNGEDQFDPTSQPEPNSVQPSKGHARQGELQPKVKTGLQAVREHAPNSQDTLQRRFELDSLREPLSNPRNPESTAELEPNSASVMEPKSSPASESSPASVLEPESTPASVLEPESSPASALEPESSPASVLEPESSPTSAIETTSHLRSITEAESKSGSLISKSLSNSIEEHSTLNAPDGEFHEEPHPNQTPKFGNPIEESGAKTEKLSQPRKILAEKFANTKSGQALASKAERSPVMEQTNPSSFPTLSPLPPSRAPTMGPTVWAPDPRIAVFVMSGRGNFEARKAIRETWAKNRKNIMFVVGDTWCGVPTKHLSNFYPCALDPETVDPNTTADGLSKLLQAFEASQVELNSRLLKEMDEFKDILALKMLDSYGNLAEKTKKTIEWAAANRPYSWVFKVDDDAVVNLDALESYLAKKDVHGLRLIGSFERKSIVLRTSKWAELRFKEDYFPVYPQGSTGYVFSGALIQKLAASSHELELYRNEDASVGIWLRQLGLTNGTVVFDEDRRFHKEWLYNIHSCMAERRFSRKFTFSHDLKPDDIRKCYEHLISSEKAWQEKLRRKRHSKKTREEEISMRITLLLGNKGRTTRSSDEQFLLSRVAMKKRLKSGSGVGGRSEEHVEVSTDGVKENVAKRVILLRDRRKWRKDRQRKQVPPELAIAETA